MISRLTTLATAFAILGSASLGYAASARQTAVSTPAAATQPMRIVQLEHVVVTAKRSDYLAR